MSLSGKLGRLRPFQFKNSCWLWLSAAVIVADQISKQLVEANIPLFVRIRLLPFLNLTNLHNTGAAFSSFSDLAPMVFVGLGIIVSIAILIWLHRHPHSDRLLAASLALILGGALGNAIDRAARGFVIDFIDVHAASWHWPAFNVADSAITIGAVLILLDMWCKRESHAAPG